MIQKYLWTVKRVSYNIGRYMEEEANRYDTVRVDGNNLRGLRKAAKLTQRRLAENLCHPGYISAMETGAHTEIGRDLAEGLAKTLRVKLEEILAQTPKPVPRGPSGRRSRQSYDWPLGRNRTLSNPQSIGQAVLAVFKEEGLTEEQSLSVLSQLPDLVRVASHLARLQNQPGDNSRSKH